MTDLNTPLAKGLANSVFIRSDSTRFDPIRFAEFIETEHTPFAIWVHEFVFARIYISLQFAMGLMSYLISLGALGPLGAIWVHFGMTLVKVEPT